jgi:UDP-galactopyranose mutase
MESQSFKADFLIVGCGFAGATFARMVAENGYTSHIIDKRDHIGGNSYTYRDEEIQVEIHKYGPHIFHTSSKEIWDFMNRFTSFNNFVNRVKAITGGQVYSLPINLHTINQFFHRSLNPADAEKFIDRVRYKNLNVTNFEESLLSSIGQDLYEAFFKYYTLKQWGVDPKEIIVSTAKRLPIRFNYNDNYYDDTYQGIPIEGYTKIFKRMLNHSNIKVFLETDFDEYKNNWRQKYKNLVYTGSIDEYFSYRFGYLPYRSVLFDELRGTEIQGNAVINYTDMSVPYTRIHEHKWFTPDIKFEGSIAFKEYSESSDSRKNPFYPIRNNESDRLYNKYLNLTTEESGVIFIGRLAEFKYYDMHQVIGSAISKFKDFIKS